MPLFLYRCGSCGAQKKHFVSTESTKKVTCVCGEKERYVKAIGNFQSQVNYKTLEEIMENEIDPFVDQTWQKMGRDLVNGDVKVMENIFGEDKMKETFYDQDTWVDEDSID